MKVEHSPERSYRMRARAASVQGTRERILAAADDLFMEQWMDEVSLRDIAARAGVALQTVVRHFGTREGLLEAIADQLRGPAERLRFAAPVGDIPAAVSMLVSLYEDRAPRMLRTLAQEDRIPALRPLIQRARDTHHQWIAEVFAPMLPARDPARSRRTVELAAVTDVYMWKVLRQDHGLSPEATEAALVEMIGAICRQEDQR